LRKIVTGGDPTNTMLAQSSDDKFIMFITKINSLLSLYKLNYGLHL
jgi:hypothetical protein